MIAVIRRVIAKSVSNKTVELGHQSLTHEVLFPDTEHSATEPAQCECSIFTNEMWKRENI